MANTTDIRNGTCISYNNALYTVTYFQHVKPGKGSAFVKTKLKGVVNKKNIAVTFNAGENIVVVRTMKKSCQFLYKDGDYYHFMDQATFETLPVPVGSVTNAAFLADGAMVDIVCREDTQVPLTCSLPPIITLEVTHTERGAKGNTATKATKPATLSTGATVQVPLFINIGERINIDTSTGQYSGRASAS